MEGQFAKIIEASKELSAKEKVMLKDLSNAQPLDSLVKDGDRVLLNPDYYVIIAIHNEKARDGNTDYENIVIIDKTGDKYKTGSQSFITAFQNIMADMEDCDEEWSLEVYARESRNREGKYFITCSVV